MSTKGGNSIYSHNLFSPFLIVAEGEVSQWINPFFKTQIKLIFFMVYKEMLEMWQIIVLKLGFFLYKLNVGESSLLTNCLDFTSRAHYYVYHYYFFSYHFTGFACRIRWKSCRSIRKGFRLQMAVVAANPSSRGWSHRIVSYDTSMLLCKLSFIYLPIY